MLKTLHFLTLTVICSWSGNLLKAQKVDSLIQEMLFVSYDNACKGKWSEAANLFNKLLPTKSIYSQDYREYQTIGIHNYLNCDRIRREKKILFLNYGHHMPLQKTIVTQILRIATLYNYSRILFVNNDPVEAFEDSKNSFVDSYVPEEDPQYNFMLNDAVRSSFSIKVVDTRGLNLDSIVSEICDYIYQDPTLKTLIISNTTFSVHSAESFKTEEAFVAKLRSFLGKSFMSIDQTSDLNNYDKGNWRTTPDLYILSDSLGQAFSAKPYHDLFLFSAYSNEKHTLEHALNLSKYPLTLNRKLKHALYVEAFRHTSTANVNLYFSNLEDKITIKPNSYSLLHLEKGINYNVRFLDKHKNLIKEEILKIPRSLSQ